MEKQMYTQWAPQLRNKLLMGNSGDIDGVEGTEIQTIRLEQLTMEPPTMLEASGLEIPKQIVGRKKGEEDELS